VEDFSTAQTGKYYPLYIVPKIDNSQAIDRRKRRLADGENQAACEDDASNGGKHNNMLMMRVLGPLINFVDRPWKVKYFSDF
jgi:hypothetical protein